MHAVVQYTESKVGAQFSSSYRRINIVACQLLDIYMYGYLYRLVELCKLSTVNIVHSLPILHMH